MSTSMGKGMDLISQMALKLSLVKNDARWSGTVSGSLFMKPFLAITNAIESSLPKSLGSFGSLLQKISFALSTLLFLLIGHPKFANDKVWLGIVCLSSLAIWMLGRLMHGKEKRSANAFDAIVLIYLAMNIVAACASHYFMPSLKGLAKVIIYIGSYFLFTANLNASFKRKMIIFCTVLATGVGLSLYGLYQYKIGVAPLATWEDPSIEGGGTRIFATLGNPNLLAGLLVPLAPLALGLTIGSFAKKKFLPAIIFGGTAALLTLASLLTGSRGGMLGLIGGFGVILYIGTVWLWVNSKSKKMKPLIIGGAVALVAVAVVGVTFIPSVNQRFQSIFNTRTHSSNSYRMNVYSASFKMFKDNWWLGVGPGNETFRLAYGLYMVSSFDALGTYCVPLEVAVEAGVGGLAAFILMILIALSRGHIKFWNGKDPLAQWFAVGLTGGLIAMMVHGLGDTVFYRPQVHFLFWLMLAALATQDAPNISSDSDLSISQT